VPSRLVQICHLPPSRAHYRGSALKRPQMGGQLFDFEQFFAELFD
jgi:hypothetical protein